MRRFLIPMIAVLLFAFWLRIDALDAYPPGISIDESRNAIDAFTIGQSGHLPLFEDPDQPEHLHRILLATSSRLFGGSVWSFRVTWVFVGLLTVALAYWAACQALHDLSPARRRVAGLAAAGSLAVAMNHVVLSRSLYRGLLEPPLALLFIGFLLHGLRSGRRRDFVLSGASLGLAWHSYTAALDLPAALGFVGLHLLIFHRKTWRTWLPNLIWLGVTFALITAPIMWLLLTDSDRVLSRANDVSGGRSWDSHRVRLLIEQFYKTGDVNSQYNAYGRPLLPPGFAYVFYLGLIALLVRARQAASALIGSLLVLAAIPVYMAGEIPHGLRIAGELAVFPLIVATGIGLLLAVIRPVPRPAARQGLVAGLAALVLGVTLIGGLRTHHDYLAWWDDSDNTWFMFERQMPGGEWFFRTDLRDLGRWLSDQDGPLLVPVDAVEEKPTRAWLLRDYPHVRSAGDDVTLPPETRLVVPWAVGLNDLWRETPSYALLDRDTITLLPPLTEAAHTDLLEGIDEAAGVWRANGDLLVRVKPLPSDFTLVFEPRHTIAPDAGPLAVFDDGVTVVAWRGPETLSIQDIPQTVTFTLEWSATQSLNHYYSVFVQFQTQDYNRLIGDDQPLLRALFPPMLWQPGEAAYDRHTLTLPANLAPGAYRLVVGLYYSTYTDKRLFAKNALGGVLDGTLATVGWIKVPPPDEVFVPPDVVPVDTVLADSFRLVGGVAAWTESGDVNLTLYWEAAAARSSIDATIFVHVLDETGTLVAQNDSRPWNGQYPTCVWDQGEIVQTEHGLALGDVDVSGLRVNVGMYIYPSLDHLPVEQAGALAPNNVIDLGTLETLFTP